ncbi:MAG: DUF1848 domain-containing protein [Armatimonadetes bacterium]|nr:DUF1848 domain-containing protein [Armatimonadota bacterium]
MIISASRKTDLPAFYGEWFRNRFRAGYCRVVNAYNRAQQRSVSLLPADVDGFVFWTKNLGPFFPALDDVATVDVPFVVHYTINPYPGEIESAVAPPSRSVEHCRRLAREHGPRRLVWRYDPILSSDLTPPEWHVRQFARLAAQLEGCTDEVATKFLNPYDKTRRNLDRSAARHGYRWWDPPVAEKTEIVRQLAGIAAEHGMTLRVCCQPELEGDGVAPAVCIDAARLAALGGRLFRAEARAIRTGCRCAASVDIGEYDTCPHGCVYCYAVQRPEAAAERYGRHDPAGEYLFPPDVPAAEPAQMALF